MNHTVCIQFYLTFMSRLLTCNNKYPCAGEYCPSQYLMYRVVFPQSVIHSVYSNTNFCDVNIILYCVMRKNLRLWVLFVARARNNAQ